MEGFAKAGIWPHAIMSDCVLHDEWVITATICRYDILALGSVMCTDRFLNHCIQYLVQCCVTIASTCETYPYGYSVVTC